MLYDINTDTRIISKDIETNIHIISKDIETDTYNF